MSDRISVTDLLNAQTLLDDLFKEVSSEEGTLAGGTKLGVGGRTLQSLRETRVTFGNPKNNLIRLSKKLFDSINVDLSAIYKRQMRDQFDFYYMTQTVSMQPKRGVQFIQIECSFDFGPKGESEPIVQTIFPVSKWKEVLNWGGEMRLALDGNFEWGVEIDKPNIAIVESLPVTIKTNIAERGKLNAFIVLPHYSFNLGRAEIVATGEGNSNCFWRIENPDLQKVFTMQFGLVFKVPKNIQTIELTGLVAARPSINWLVANLRNVIDDLNDKLQELLRLNDNERSGENCLPVGDHEKWVLELPG